MSPRKSTAEIVKEIKQAGGCSHPIRLRGEFIDTRTGEVNERSLLVACKDRRVIVCPSCSYLYKADAWIIVSTGLVGGKGVPSSVREHPRLFVTLTAPSFGIVHARRESGPCRATSRPPCHHGLSTGCNIRHNEDDPLVGSPLCDRCFDYVGAVLWNAEASRLWNRSLEQVRRRLSTSQNCATGQALELTRLSYIKVAEFQRRGLAHFHVIVRADGYGNAFSSPPAHVSSDHLAEVIASVASHFSITGSRGVVSWGRQFSISDASALERDDLRIAAYLAKYATKTTDGTKDFARRFRSRAEILRLDSHSHLRRLALTTWDLALDPDHRDMNLRAHAHTFGYRGHLITKSRHFSTRFQDLRDARADFMATSEPHDPVAGTFAFDGRGYDDPHTTEVAEFLYRLSLEARKATSPRLTGVVETERPK